MDHKTGIMGHGRIGEEEIMGGGEHHKMEMHDETSSSSKEEDEYKVEDKRHNNEVKDSRINRFHLSEHSNHWQVLMEVFRGAMAINKRDVLGGN